MRWWDKECEKVIKNRKRKLKIWKSTRTLKDKIEYNKARAEARKIINRKKRKDFYEFCNSINKYMSMKYIWNVMRSYKNARKLINWNTWHREEEIVKTVEGLTPLWVTKEFKRTKHEAKCQNIDENFTKLI